MARRIRANILLILAAAIWGGAFVAQSVGGAIGALTFNGARSLVGAGALLPLILVLDRLRPVERKRWPWKAGAVCGLLVTAATTLQQFGLKYTTAGKAGFITALYIILVPVVSLLPGLRSGARRPVQTVAALVLAVSGMYLLCIEPGASLVPGTGDLLMLGCAAVFTAHILVIDRAAPQEDCLKLCCVQFLICGVICTAGALIFERDTLSVDGIASAWLPILYAGVLSSGLAYTLQMLGQRESTPTVAALIMSLESVFAVLGGWLLLHEQLTPRELGGCALMMVAIVAAQLPSLRKSLSPAKKEPPAAAL